MVKSAKRNGAVRRQTSRRRRILLESLEPRQLLAANLGSTGGVNPGAIVEQDDSNLPANIGTVDAVAFSEDELAGTVGQNDSTFDAEFIPLGTRLADEPKVDISGTLSLYNSSFQNQAREDVDFYAVDLRAGDILDLAGTGSTGSIDVLYANGSRWFGMDSNQSNPLLYPVNSPLQTLGNVAGSQVVPETGRYYIRVGTNGLAGNYTLGARAYRPVLESEPIGTQQTLFIDFDGFTAPRSVVDPIDLDTGLPNTGTIRIDPMRDYFFNFNLQLRDENELIDEIVSRVQDDFWEFLPPLGGNGDYANTGTPGEYGIQILNSRDHADPGNQEHVTRVVVGGVSSDLFLEPLLGISETIDVGNFDTSEIVFAVLDEVIPYTTGIPISGAASQLDLIAQTLAVTVSHEAGHSFGLFHTDGTNQIGSMIDGPGPPVQAFDFELGPDGIFGTQDDQELIFPEVDRFSTNEGFFGYERVAASLAHALSTGTQGQSITGRVFSDVNGDGRGNGDAGIGGITVFADIDNDGVQDGSEPNTVTSANGTYQLNVGSGPVNVAIVPPTGSVPTTPVSQNTVVPGEQVDFGLTQLRQETGRVFADLNGNGSRETNEPGLEGAYVYIDVNGNDRIDLGEPSAISAADGSYTIDFPGPGTYTLRQVAEPGFIQTVPASGEWVVSYDGVSLDQNYPFGNLPARDFGDAPAAYAVTSANNGASHGISPGLSLGLNVDRELDGQPSDDAQGDDENGVLQSNGEPLDDEDGVTVISPVGIGETATLQVVVRNNGGTAFLSGWMDFDRDNQWEANEQVIVDRAVGTSSGSQTLTIPIQIPASATAGDVVARFRLSRESGLGPAGPTDAGEVEDYIFTVQPSADLVNDDAYTVSRNTVGNVLDVLSNDFQTPSNPLSIAQLNTGGTRGSVQISGNGQTVLYTPPNGFTGRDVFSYLVAPTPGSNASVEDRTATVVVNVSFQTEDPIAVDDTFEVAQGSVNLPLNVLDNDIPSVNGGVTIVSVGGATRGGRLQITGGGQSILYTPAVGFVGTEQFSYSILDSAGRSSSAQVTINTLPGSRQDDQVAFILETFDANDNRPLENVQVGDDFLLRVSVDDVRNFSSAREGVVSAFLDLLYSDGLVSLIPQTGGAFPFEITFGPLFAGAGGSAGFQQGDADTPGLLNEIGGLQTPGLEQTHTGPVTLFTVRMQAISPGVATFQADPADRDVSEVLVLDQDTVVPVGGLRLGNHQLRIEPRATDGNFTTAVDDSFPDGVDSNGNVITRGGSAMLDVLDNDVISTGAQLQDFGITVQPQFGTVTVNDAGTSDPSDDFIVYQANVGQQGVERFNYFIADTNGVRSTAQVSFNVGDVTSQAAIDFQIVDEAGNPIDEIGVGQRFGVQVILDDLRSPLTASGLFAGYLDVLYESGLVTPTDTFGSALGFDAQFNEASFDADRAVGSASTPGIINEFGTLAATSDGSADAPGGAPQLMATLYFRAEAPGTATFVGDKADFSPFQDTLFFEPPERIDPSLIRYDVASITITGSAEGESALQNLANPLDVNNDGYVSPIDALGVINSLNQRVRVGEGETAGTVTRFADVNGDREITPVDALMVINALNKQSTLRRMEMEGESIPVPLIPVTPPNTTASSEDVVYAGLEAEGESVASPTATASVETQAASAGAAVPMHDVQSAGEDDEDDILTLLADDVSNVWK